MLKNISLIVLVAIVAGLLFGMLSILGGRDLLISSKDEQIAKSNNQILEIKKELSNAIKEKDNLAYLYAEEKNKKKWDDLKDFGTIEELEEFLELDKTNEQKFKEEAFDCDDFSIMLQNNAVSAGYRMSLQVELGQEESHLLNLVIIEQPRKRVVFIEPQDDKIYLGPFFDKE